MRIRGKFPVGHKLAPGGARDYGHKPGPKPNWYKIRCANILRNKRLFDFLGEVAVGEKVDRYVTLSGKVVMIPANVKNRINAILELRDTAFGKPGQSVDFTSGGMPIVASMLEEARKRADS